MNPSSPVVELRSISHRYGDDKLALDDISFSVAAGERVALIGSSGAGKSTLLRTMNGLVIPTGGELRVLDEEIKALSESRLRILRRQIGMVFQEFALIERLPVLTNVLVGRLGYTPALPSLLRSFAKEDVARARDAIYAVGLTGYEDQLVRKLSGGQKQRVGIARALVQEAPLILGDEPTANLDIRTADEILALLVNLASARGATLILSLHDVRAARQHCSRIIALREGRLVWDGSAPEFGEAEIEKTFY